jgi:hypothetical protein
MKLGTHMPDGERRKPIDIEVCRSKVKVILSIHMFATRLSHLWCITDFFKFRTQCKIFFKTNPVKYYTPVAIRQKIVFPMTAVFTLTHLPEARDK